MLPIDKPSIRPGKNIPEDMILGIEKSGLYLGLEDDYGKGYYVGKKSEDDGNALVVGINGSGKSYILAKSMVETWQDPFGGDAPYEPFTLLKRDEAYFMQNVCEIVNIIIPMPLNDPNSYWIVLARNLLSAVIVYYFSIGLDFIETIIMAVDTSVSELCHKIIRSNCSLAKKFIGEIAGLKSEHQAIIGTEMKRHLMPFATDQVIQDALSNNQSKKAFSWEDIVTADDAPNVFLRLSQDRMEQWGGMIRLMLTQLIRTLERRPDKQSLQGRKISPSYCFWMNSRCWGKWMPSLMP